MKPPEAQRDLGDVIERCVRAVTSAAPAVARAEDLGSLRFELREGLEKGYFPPDTDERFREGFSLYLTGRAVLLETISELKPVAVGAVGADDDSELRLRSFLVAYTAACLLVRAGRFIVGESKGRKLVRDKLNEPAPEYGIPAGQFTAVYYSLTHPLTAWRLYRALQYADRHRAELEALGRDPLLAPLLEFLAESEPALRVDKTRYLKGRLRYWWYSYRRRRLSAYQQVMFALLEGAGRVVAEIHVPGYRRRVNPTVRKKLSEILQPGDVLVTRHHDAMSNLFLPGYWPHAALHIGSAESRSRIGVEVDGDCAARWCGNVEMLEAKKDGVLFRPLEETLQVDSVAVIRPQLDTAEIAKSLSRVVTHEGKLYDFVFDFSRSDRLVCTEVVYRCYHGIGGIEIPLTRRAGRMTLAAQDLLDLAVEGQGFDPVAVFGTPDSQRRVVVGEEARRVLSASYREEDE